MLNNKIKIIVIILFVAVYTGCAGLGESKTEWNKLTDRIFCFTEFQYIYKGADSKQTYDMMCSFPVKQMMYILSKEYNIKVDMIDYSRFIKSGNLNDLTADGLIRNEKFTWKRDYNDINDRISIIFEKDYFDESKMKFSLFVFSNKKKIKSMQIDFTRMDYLFKQMKFYIPKTDEYIDDFNKNDYITKDIIPGLILTDQNSYIIKDANKNTEIKIMIEDYVKTLDPEQKKAFKHEMIDHIYKICE